MDSVSLKDLSKEVNTMSTPKEKSVFEVLNAIDVNDHKEEKKGLSYLSWSWAWSELQKRYPDASYTIAKFGDLRKPYLYDENTGYMVFTTVTIKDQTREMWLPVMDGANKAMKSAPYQYTVMVWSDTENKKVPVTKTVQAATMFDINKAIMRCLVKNIGMFGLGLYIYSGEDLPEQDDDEQSIESKQKKPQENKQEKPKEQNINDLVVKWNSCRNKLFDLGVDVRSENIMQWMADQTGYPDQEADLTDAVKMQKMIVAYNTLIKGKEEKMKKDANG